MFFNKRSFQSKDKNNVEFSNDVKIVPYLLFGCVILFFVIIGLYNSCKGLNQSKNGNWNGNVIGKKANLGKPNSYEIFLESNSNIEANLVDTFKFSNLSAFKIIEPGDFFYKKAGEKKCIVTITKTMDTLIFNPDSNVIDKIISK